MTFVNQTQMQINPTHSQCNFNLLSSTVLSCLSVEEKKLLCLEASVLTSATGSPMT